MSRRALLLRPLLLGLAMLVGLGACGSSTHGTTTTHAPSLSTIAGASTTAGATGTTGTANSVLPGSTTNVSVPASGDVEHLTSVQAAAEGTNERVVFEFQTQVPGYVVGYITPPLRQDATGSPIAIQGDNVLQVKFSEASGTDLTGGVHKTYTGPTTITPPDSQAVVQLVQAGDFEGTVTWGIGTHGKVPFAVSTLQGPPRVIIDFGR